MLDLADDTWAWNFRSPPIPSIKHDTELIFKSTLLLLSRLMEAPKHQLDSDNLEEPLKSFIHSFDQKPWAELSNALPEHSDRIETVYTRFKCSSGAQGVLVSESQFLHMSLGMPLEIWTFEAVAAPERGLLVRPQDHGPNIACGLAVFDHPALWSKANFGPGGHRIEHWATLGPMELLEMQRIRVLNQRQLQDMCARWMRGTGLRQPNPDGEIIGLNTFGPVWTWGDEH
jgi:hypothetical protein